VKFLTDPFYEEVMAEAQDAASKAAEEWLEQNSNGESYEDVLLGNTGVAYITFTDSRKNIPKYFSRKDKAHGYKPSKTLPLIYEHIDRKEVGCRLAAVNAALTVFKKFSLDDGMSIKIVE